jgi:hypothetical protein
MVPLRLSMTGALSDLSAMSGQFAAVNFQQSARQNELKADR